MGPPSFFDEGKPKKKNQTCSFRSKKKKKRLADSSSETNNKYGPILFVCFLSGVDNLLPFKYPYHERNCCLITMSWDPRPSSMRVSPSLSGGPPPWPSPCPDPSRAISDRRGSIRLECGGKLHSSTVAGIAPPATTDSQRTWCYDLA
jgi:hypothetical protein